MSFGLHVRRERTSWGFGIAIGRDGDWDAGVVVLAGPWTVLLGWVKPGWERA